MSRLGIKYTVAIFAIVLLCIATVTTVYLFQLQKIMQQVEHTSSDIVTAGLENVDQDNARVLADRLAADFRRQVYYYTVKELHMQLVPLMAAHEVEEVSVFDETGRLIADGKAVLKPGDQISSPEKLQGMYARDQLVTIEDTGTALRTTRIITWDGELIGGLSFRTPKISTNAQSSAARSALETTIEESTRRLLMAVILAALLTLCIGGIVTLTLAKRLTRPIGLLADEVERVRDGEFGRTITTVQKDEIGDLCTSFNDMSRSLQLAEEARKQAARSEQERIAANIANRAKSEFLASVSHELRTPLNGILGMAQVLASSSQLNRQQNECITTILESGNTLTALLSDVLDLSKIEAGKLEIAPIDENIRTCIDHVHNLFRTLAQEKGLDLIITVNDEIPERLHFDPIRIRQCLSNLVSNAIKFTEQGSITLEARGQQAEDGWDIAISITDTGIGIDRETCQRLFDPFTQADASITRNYGGTGLGLNITRQLARLMGGDVTVTSIADQGSTFTLKFHAANPKGAESGDMTAEQMERTRSDALSHFHRKRLLLVEDNVVNRKVARLFLQPLEMDIVDAENGVVALELLQAQNFDLILMDVHMPEMDGFTATQEIRKRNWPARDIPIIALTADAMSGDREKCIAVGMDDYAPKPLDVNALFAAMLRATHKKKSELAGMTG